MFDEHVTSGEFARTADRIFLQLDRIEDKQDRIAERVLVLETNQTQAGKLAAKLSAGIGVLVAGLINGVLALLTNRS